MADTWYIQFDGGAYAGRGYSPDGTIPLDAVRCAQEQYTGAGQWTSLVNGEIILGVAPSRLIYIPAALVRQRLQADGKWDAAWAAMSGPQQGEFCTLQLGILQTDSSVIALLDQIGADPTAILAVPT